MNLRRVSFNNLFRMYQNSLFFAHVINKNKVKVLCDNEGALATAGAPSSTCFRSTSPLDGSGVVGLPSVNGHSYAGQ